MKEKKLNSEQDELETLLKEAKTIKETIDAEKNDQRNFVWVQH